MYDNKKTDFGIKFNDETKKFPKYTGGFNVRYDGRDISVDALATKKGETYNTRWTVQHQKGQKSTILGSFKMPSNTSIEAESNIRIYKQKPISVSLSGDIDLKSPKVNVDVTKGQDKYKAMAEMEYTPMKYGRVASELTYSSRSVKLEAEGGEKSGRYVGKFDVAWNATINPDQRVLLEVSSRVIDIKDFEGYLITQIPGHQISANVRNSIRNSIDSSFEVSWAPSKKISAMVQFTNNRRKYKGETSAAVGFTTPFKNFEEYKLAVGHSYNKKSYESMISVTYGKMKTVSATAITQIPVAIDDFDFELRIKTPSRKVGNPVVKISQNLPNNIKHYAKISVKWGNKQFVNVETNGVTQPYKMNRRVMSRNIGFTSSFLGYESVIVNMTHNDNLEKFDSRATINHNGVKYEYKIKMSHFYSNWQVDHSGSFEIKSRFDTLTMVWDMKNSDKDLRSSVTINWGNGQRFNAILNGDIVESPNRRYTSRFEMNVPSNTVRRVDVNFEHEDRAGFIKTEGSIMADRKNIGTVKVDYQRQLDSADFDFEVTSIYMHDKRVTMNSKHAIMPMTAVFEVEWAPRQKITMDSRYSLIDRTLDSMVTLKTPFHPVNNIVLKATHKLVGFSWVAEGSVEYAPYQSVVVGSTYRLDLIEKAVSIHIKTPFPQFNDFQTGFRFNGDEKKFDASADFKAYPYVRDIKATASYKTGRRSIGKLSLTTPFRTYPGFKAELTDMRSSLGRDSVLWIEYLPGQKIEIDSKHSLNKDAYDGTFIVKTPFSHPVNIEYRQNGDLDAFSNHAEVRYNFNQSITIDTTFGRQPKIYGTYSMLSPIRGYEEVKFAFSHEGQQWKNFRTEVEYGTDGNKIGVEAMLNIVKDYEGKLMLTTPFPDMLKRQLAFSHEGSPMNFKTHAEAVNNDKILSGDAVFSHTMQDTIGSITVKTPFKEVKLAQLAFNKQGTLDNFRTHGETALNNRKVESDVIFSHNDRVTSGSLNIKSPVKGWEETVVTFSRDGSLDSFKANGEVRYSDKKIEGSIDHTLNKDDMSSTATLSSPFTEPILLKLVQNTRPKGFTNDLEVAVGKANSWKTHTFYRLRRGNLKFSTDYTVVAAGETHAGKVSAEHKGKLSDFTTKVESTWNARKSSVNVQYSGKKWENIDLAVKMELPHPEYDKLELILRNSKSGTAHKMDLDVQYATGKKITTKSSLAVNLPDNEASIAATSPFKDYKTVDVVFTNKNSSNVMTTLFNVDAEKSQLARVSSSLNLKTYMGEVSVYSENDQIFNIKYSKDQGRRQLDSMVKYNKTMTVSMGTGCQVNLPDIDCDLRIATPYSEDIDLKLKNAKQSDTYTSSVTGTYGQEIVSATSSVTVNLPEIDIRVRAESPFHEDVDIQMVNSKQGDTHTSSFTGKYGPEVTSATSTITINLPEIDCNLQISSPHAEDITLKLKNSQQGNTHTSSFSGKLGQDVLTADSIVTINTPEINCDFQFLSPWSENIVLKLKNSKQSQTLTSSIMGKYGQKEEISASSTVTVNLPDIDANVKVTSPWTEDFTATVKKSVTQQQYSAEIGGSFGFSSLNAKCMFSRDLRSINTGITFTSPSAKDFSMNYIINLNPRDFSTEIGGKLGRKSLVYKARMMVDLPNFESSSSFVSPYTEDFASSLMNRVSGNEYTTELSGNYGNRRINTKSVVTLDLPSLSVEYVLQAPFTEDVSINFSHDVRRKTYTTTATTTYGAKTATMTSAVKADLPNLSVNIKTTNTFCDYKSMDFDLTHKGEWHDMQCDVTLNGDQITGIVAETKFRYADPFDIQASAKLNSGFEGFENVGMSMKNSKQNSQYMSHIDVTLDAARDIVMDGSYEIINSGERNMNVQYNFVLTTPFKEVKRIVYRATSSVTGFQSRATEYLEYNGKAYADHTTTANFDPNGAFYTYHVDMRAPRDMEFSFELKPDYHVGKLSLNWDKLDPDSNFNLDYNLEYKGIEVYLEGKFQANAVHPRLSIKLEKEFFILTPKLESKLMLTIDNGSPTVIGYDMNVDANRRFLKVMIPERTLEGEHKFDDKSDEVRVSWDADGDTDKTVVVKVVSGDNAQFDKMVELRLPNFGKVNVQV